MAPSILQGWTIRAPSPSGGGVADSLGPDIQRRNVLVSTFSSLPPGGERANTFHFVCCSTLCLSLGSFSSRVTRRGRVSGAEFRL